MAVTTFRRKMAGARASRPGRAPRLALALVALVTGCGAGTLAPARFVDATRLLVSVEGGGTVTGAGGSVHCRAGSPEGCRADLGGSGPSLLTAHADAGWRFAGWEIANADATGTPDPRFLGPVGAQDAHLYRAIFVPAPAASTARARRETW